MKKILILSALSGLCACAAMPFTNPAAPPPPATPVFFQPFSAALDPAADTTIAAFARAAAAQPEARVIVTGAADGVGSSRANKFLSETRAQVVADQLTADGVSARRIHTRAIGIAASPASPGMPAQSARRALMQLGG